jgi:HEAT repeat protein
MRLRSETPRVQRLAASALARTGDVEAIGLLGDTLAKETSDIARLDCAYALARANDKRGLEALVKSLGERRDIKAEAARRLALLGDARAAPVLEEFLAYQQFRLSAAEQLAYLKNQRAIEVLVKIRGDESTTPDDRARAAIALARAGHADVLPELHKLLADSRFNAFAAGELAAQHDVAARPLLEKQLAFPSLRVGAARALRRLDPDRDTTPLVKGLLTALDAGKDGKDTEQIQVAEAVLLLVGPASWSERE